MDTLTNACSLSKGEPDAGSSDVMSSPLPKTEPRVPFADLVAHHAEILPALREAFERVLRANAFILGEEVERFESEFASYCDVRHCVGVASGTAALTLALLAAGIGRGDEVIVPAQTYIASALAVVNAGATPVFCEVEARTGLIDVPAAESLVGARTAAVMAVHLYGQVCDMDACLRLARRKGLVVLEDAAQAHGAVLRDRRAGSLGTAAGFSFYPSKNLGALGDGGAICTNDAQIAERARMLRNLGQRRKGEHVIAGFNERLDGLQAAMLRVKLPHLDGWNAARRRAAEAYRETLPAGLSLLEERSESPCIYHLFPVRLSDRNHFARTLAACGVETGVHYWPAVIDQPPFARRAHAEAPNARAWAAEELSLPMFAGLRSEQIEAVARAFSVASATPSG